MVWIDKPAEPGAALAASQIPTDQKLTAVLQANSAAPLLAWFSAFVVKSLRGELKKKHCRPKG